MQYSYQLSLFAITCSIVVSILHAQDEIADAVVAAKVDGQPIYAREIEREVKKVVKDREVDPAASKILRAQALEQMISRRLILMFLKSKQLGPSDADIEHAVERAKNRLKQQELTLEQFLNRSGLTEDEFRQTLQWQIGWNGYLEKYLTDENLQNYFAKNQKEFDGSQLRISQILFKVKSDDDQQTWDQAMKKAAQVGEALRSKEMDFATAAKNHSNAPSASKGGDVGLISRHEPMPESFSIAAFALEQGEVSKPIKSPFGVHLIQCVEIKPGQKRWQDVRKELEVAVMKYLFDWIADQQRPNAVIEYTGSVPHFKSGTKELAD